MTDVTDPGVKKIWLIAAENDALPGGKVGGVGDVVRDLPIALAALGQDVSVIIPSYGMFHKLPGAGIYTQVEVEFAGRTHLADIYQVAVADSPVKQFVVEHPLLSPNGPGQIYVYDEPGKPFAIDAAKFAFFNAVIAAWVNQTDTPPDVLHLNDWHTGLIPALRKFGRPDAALAAVRVVFTIHNLAYQGVRPLQWDDSSLETWFPDMLRQADNFRDPAYENCVNFMVSAIRMADDINTVSPNYAMEIQRPSEPSIGFSGGEGLESDLRKAHEEGRLIGILNGCMYPENTDPTPAWDELLQLILKRPEIFNARLSADDWIEKYKGSPPQNFLCSIGRVVDQKVPLFLESVSGYDSALAAILAASGPDSLFIMLGSGERELEDRFVEIARQHDNFVYLRGYVESLSGPLYSMADLFLMPSSFEPCGISQMLSMRAGQPCVVHAVGGLKDTVEHANTGFVFDGNSPAEQATNFVSCVQNALSIKLNKPAQWEKICSNAAGQRFSWEVAAITYIKKLYRCD